MDPKSARELASMVLAGIHREYPNKIAHFLHGDLDVKAPHELTPAFFGCFDWHSAVHGHWTLVRLVRTLPGEDWVETVMAALERSLTSSNLEAELAYLKPVHRRGFERPYGIAWLLMLAAELEETSLTPGDPQAARFGAMARHLVPLEEFLAGELIDWLPRLSHPIRSGEHSQTAFAMGLAHDWARIRKRDAARQRLEDRALAFHLGDLAGPLRYEPSGHDFLSPCLAEADLLRRVLSPEEFGAWLERFLPAIPQDGTDEWLPVDAAVDAEDGKLVHLDGLCLSRAWMLEGIASGLPAEDPRIPALIAAAARHAAVGRSRAFTPHYAGSHWLGTYATYQMTRRGLS